MNANSPSESLWQILHQAGALFNDEGFAAPLPPFPVPTGEVQSHGSGGPEGYDDWVSRYNPHLMPGTVWPPGRGGSAPQALLLTSAPLSEEAWTFVRSWFENSRVNLTLAADFFTQPVPMLDGEQPPYHAMAKDLCHLLNPKALLSLGPGPAQKLLGAPLSLDTLRGSDYRFDRWSIVTTLDPEEFLTLEEAEKTRFKAQVWRDLQRLLGKLKYG